MTVETLTNKAVESDNLLIGIFKRILTSSNLSAVKSLISKCGFTELFLVSDILIPWHITCDSRIDGDIWSVMITNE